MWIFVSPAQRKAEGCQWLSNIVSIMKDSKQFQLKSHRFLKEEKVQRDEMEVEYGEVLRK